ncbi:MAG: phosphodiester glycosidase family protein [Nanoarchaeota archaeon]|nr:phosphodiester glycosidase family protein [Nanoarchaeota archaeon]
MKYIITICVCISLVLVSLLLVSCGNGAEPEPTPAESAEEPEPTEISYQISSPQVMLYYNDEYTEIPSDLEANNGLLVINNENTNVQIIKPMDKIINQEFGKMQVIEYFSRDFPDGCIKIEGEEVASVANVEIKLFSDKDCESASPVKSFVFEQVDISVSVKEPTPEPEHPDCIVDGYCDWKKTDREPGGRETIENCPEDCKKTIEEYAREDEILRYNEEIVDVEDKCLDELNLENYRFDILDEKYNGVYYSKQYLKFNDPEFSTGRHLMVHTLKIDLHKVNLFVTPPIRDTMSTSDFQSQGLWLFDDPFDTFPEYTKKKNFNMDIAVNGGGFTPEYKGSRVTGYNVDGPVISLGDPYIYTHGQALVVYEEYEGEDEKRVERADIKYVDDFDGIDHAIPAVNELVVNKEIVNNVDHFRGGPTYARSDVRARTTIGLDTENNVLILVIVDEKPRELDPREHSIGANLKEVACLQLAHGANKAINMDGGDSTTLVFRNREIVVPDKNWFRHPVKNHLGIKLIPELSEQY